MAQLYHYPAQEKKFQFARRGRPQGLEIPGGNWRQLGRNLQLELDCSVEVSIRRDNNECLPIRD